VTELRTEEEQLDAIKSWWKDNGKSLVIMIAVAVSAVYGYKAWQNKQVTTSENASVMYQQLIAAVVPDQQADAVESLATSKHLAKTLKADYSDSQYAKFASLLMAKVAVNSGDLTTAQAELNWLLATEPKALLKSIALIRKAQILAEQKEFDQALALLKSVSSSALQVQAAELEGDIYLAQGDKKQARAAYEKAIANRTAGSNQAVISMKLNDLTTEEG
jgi:predicted negative regulator of RcsB-dependent stress response